jgi:lipooligosaccharide transport system ATP-binding protein
MLKLRNTLTRQIEEVRPRRSDRLLLYTTDGERALEQVHARNIELESALVRRSSLEDVFLRLTGRQLVE